MNIFHRIILQDNINTVRLIAHFFVVHPHNFNWRFSNGCSPSTFISSPISLTETTRTASLHLAVLNRADTGRYLNFKLGVVTGCNAHLHTM